MSAARIAVLQFPGVNCEAETVRALERAGLAAEVFRWTRPADELARFDGFVLPGGWSYQDRVRAGALAAKLPLVEALAEQAAAGRPVLGICNGAQVLVEAGLVPGDGAIELALARNRMPQRSGYLARWVTCRIEASDCVFTRGLAVGARIAMPVAHGEGRFTSARRGAIAALVAQGRTPLRYVGPDGEPTDAYPYSPNGAECAVAAVCNTAGNVLAMMPHPERVLEIGAMARDLPDPWANVADEARERGQGAHGDAPAMALMRSLALHLQEA